MRKRAWIGLAGAALVAGGLPAVIGIGPAGAGTVQGLQAHVNHIIVLMQENRSADHYFGQLNAQGQPDYEAEPTTGNPDPLNPPNVITPFHKTSLCETSDLNHSWNGTHQEFNGGAMDGFTAANDINSANSDPADPSGARTMGYYDQTDLPFYYRLFNTFATADRYFSSVLSQTYPNRFFLLAGTSFGHIRNDSPPFGGFKQRTIFNSLGVAGISWKIYSEQFAFGSLFRYVQVNAQGHLFPISQYYADAQAGTLPQVSFIDPIFVGDKNVEDDEHPPANVQVGQRFAYKVVNHLTKSVNWHDSVLFITWDEHGGFYDHVPPPAAVAPDGIAPMLQPGDTVAGFDNLGIRVPVVVVSPFSKPHYVSHTVYDHTSILKFIETRFNLPTLTARDAAADPMLDMFLFNNAHFNWPPNFAPQPAVTPCP
jgi:phospholipase C